jgi:hypothetical protein
MAKCIYSLREGQEFNREHIIPVAFGTFEPVSFEDRKITRLFSSSLLQHA